jgi:lysophospholipase L1-like esterase
MELFQEDESCLRSSCTVTGGSYDLTAQFRTHVTGGKNAGDAGPHFRIRHNEALRSHRQWLLQLAQQYHFTAVDFYGAMLQAEQEGQTNLYADGVHPNEAGYAVMARQAIQIIR